MKNNQKKKSFWREKDNTKSYHKKVIHSPERFCARQLNHIDL